MGFEESPPALDLKAYATERGRATVQAPETFIPRGMSRTKRAGTYSAGRPPSPSLGPGTKVNPPVRPAAKSITVRCMTSAPADTMATGIRAWWYREITARKPSNDPGIFAWVSLDRLTDGSESFSRTGSDGTPLDMKKKRGQESNAVAQSALNPVTSLMVDFANPI
jgi:hypothetical protein